MNIAPIYRFYLQIENGTKYPAYPIYKNDTSIDLTQESDQRFLRKALNTKIDFIADDYDLIMSASFGDEINLYFEISTDFGLTFSQYWQAKFVITDCEIDYDNKKISVQPTSADAYTTVLNGIEKEFNLIELNPDMDSVRMDFRPMLQVYIKGEYKLLNLSPGLWWEIDANETTSHSKLTGDYHFGYDRALIHINLSGTPSVDVTGTYIADDYHTNFIARTFDLTSTYLSPYYVKHSYEQHNGNWEHHLVVYNNNDVAMYEAWVQYEYSLQAGKFSFTPIAPYTGTLEGIMEWREVYTRLVCDVDDIEGNPTYDRPASDIVDYDLKYDRLYPLSGSSGSGVSYISDEFSNDATEWGKRENHSVYYLPPTRPGNQYLVPIATNLWNEVSYWVSSTYVALWDEPAKGIEWMDDAYTIDSCISVLLNQIAPSITHQPTTAYSEFLYGTSNPITHDYFRIFLTQKTNILKGKYTVPAQKAMTSLNQILNILKNAFGLYWFIDGTKLRIEHISWFMNGGSYASDIRQVGYDLTAITNIRNGKTWDYGQNKVTFEKDKLAKIYKYEWMDTVTIPFMGEQIEIESKIVDQSKTESLRVDNATSDVDYMLMYPSNSSQDGFALLIGVPIDAMLAKGASSGTKGTNNDYSTPLYAVDGRVLYHTGTLNMTATGAGTAELATFDVNGNYIGALSFDTISSSTTSVETWAESAETAEEVAFIGFRMLSGTLNFNITTLMSDGSFMLPYKSITYTDINGVQRTRNCQNGIGAMAYLQPNYLTYQMPASSIKVNGVLTTAKGLAKRKMQDVRFPADAINVDTNKLVKTVVGLGEIYKITLNLSSRTLRASLRHDTN